MMQYNEYIKGTSYSEDVVNSVRYGFQYRKIAERNETDYHFSLFDPSDILMWIANMVIGGFTWDVIKLSVNKVYGQSNINELDEDTQKILTNEDYLKDFCNCILEFNEHRMTVSDEQKKYIIEEIIADYVGKSSSEIIKKYNRLPSEQEYIDIVQKAALYARGMV